MIKDRSWYSNSYSKWGIRVEFRFLSRAFYLKWKYPNTVIMHKNFDFTFLYTINSSNKFKAANKKFTILFLCHINQFRASSLANYNHRFGFTMMSLQELTQSPFLDIVWHNQQKFVEFYCRCWNSKISRGATLYPKVTNIITNENNDHILRLKKSHNWTSLYLSIPFWT